MNHCNLLLCSDYRLALSKIKIMKKIKLNKKDISKVNFSSHEVKSLCLQIFNKNYKFQSIEERIELIEKVLSDPIQYKEDEVLSPISEMLLGKTKLKSSYEVHMLKNAGDFNVYGRRHIADNAYFQMQEAMKLSIAIKGALMPDAHHGYGLPIGAVLATHNQVIPFGIGLDIGCRMALSIYPDASNFLERKSFEVQKMIRKYTHFGNEGTLAIDVDHEVLGRQEFQSTPLLKRLHSKACYQLGSSGTGNHFVEFGYIDLEDGNDLDLRPGKYLGLLSHSGSRGLGAAIAAYYTKVAKDSCKLPSSIESLAWLNLDEEAGEEYWLSMNLAGDYAKACHDVIHANLEKVLGLKSIAQVENHHNFAWNENIDGTEYIIHRKGATPAAKGQLGIIPGSMTSQAYIVSGRGSIESLNSASHGAGRKLSRNASRQKIHIDDLKRSLLNHNVTLIGGSVEEAPDAYKDIEKVIQAQEELVKIEGTFTPKIVRMNRS